MLLRCDVCRCAVLCCALRDLLLCASLCAAVRAELLLCGGAGAGTNIAIKLIFCFILQRISKILESLKAAEGLAPPSIPILPGVGFTTKESFFPFFMNNDK